MWVLREKKDLRNSMKTIGAKTVHTGSTESKKGESWVFMGGEIHSKRFNWQQKKGHHPQSKIVQVMWSKLRKESQQQLEIVNHPKTMIYLNLKGCDPIPMDHFEKTLPTWGGGEYLWKP